MAEETSGHDASIAVWAAVVIIIVGTIVGGIALIEWSWPWFWVGVGLFVLGSVLAAFVGIMDAVDEFIPSTQTESRHPLAG